MVQIVCESANTQNLLNTIGALATKPTFFLYLTDAAGVNVLGFIIYYGPSAGGQAESIRVQMGPATSPNSVATVVGWLTTAGLAAVPDLKVVGL